MLISGQHQFQVSNISVSFQLSVFSSQFSALSFQLSVFSSQFSALSFQLSVFQISAFGFQISDSSFRFQVSDFGFRLSDSSFKVQVLNLSALSPRNAQAPCCPLKVERRKNRAGRSPRNEQESCCPFSRAAAQE